MYSEVIIKNTIATMLDSVVDFPKGDLVLLPNGGTGRVIGFQGEDLRVIEPNDGTDVVTLPTTQLKKNVY